MHHCSMLNCLGLVPSALPLFAFSSIDVSGRSKRPYRHCPGSPCRTSTCPATRLNKGEIGLCPKTLLAERGKSGSCLACPILTNSLATGPVVMLHPVLEKSELTILLCLLKWSLYHADQNYFEYRGSPLLCQL